MAIIIKNGLLVDGSGRPPIDDAIILIEENKISYAGKRSKHHSSLPRGAEIIDAEGKTVLPGLIDAHVHYGGSGGIGSPEEYGPDEVMKRLYGFLVNGVSTIRSCMDVLSYAKQLREAERKGDALIPRLFISGPCFTAPKGHGTEYARDPGLLKQMARTPTDPKKAREMVRELAKENVDFIKIIIEGRPPFHKLKTSLACAIIREAHKTGLKASVHTHEHKDALEMVKCQADSLEHGAVGIKDSQDGIIELMKKNKTYYVPTLVVHENTSMDARRIMPFLNGHQLQSSVSHVTIRNLKKAIDERKKSRESSQKERDLERIRRNMKIVHRDLMKSLPWIRNAGIPIVAGSDVGNFLTFPGVSLHRELELMVESGLSPMDAIVASTSNSARLLGVEDKLGTVEEGKLADIIIVDGKPASSTSDIRNIHTVVKNGHIIDLDELTRRINSVR